MRNLYDRLLKLLNINGRDLAVFLLALLLAFSTWLIHNLSLKYNDYLTASVIAQTNIDGHTDKSVNSAEVIARCRATGYKVITSGIKARRRPVTVSFSPSVMRHKEDDLFYVLSSDLVEYTHMIYGDGVTLEHFVTDTLFFRFPSVDHKRVPVHPVYSVSFKPQYMSDGELIVAPDTVTLYGESHRLSKIDKVYTQPIKHSDLSSDVQGVVRLEGVKNVRMSVNEVHYILDVKRYVEVVRTFPVRMENVPAGKQVMLYPSVATVSLKYSFPLESDPEEELILYVDYADYANSLSGKCNVRLKGTSRGLIDYEVDPVAVNCLQEER